MNSAIAERPASERAKFQSKSGVPIAGVSLSELVSVWSALSSEFGLMSPQLVEACSYSMAMVARFALGQSALEGKVVTFADDCPAGWVALAAMRHLITAGADGVVVLAHALSNSSQSVPGHSDAALNESRHDASDLSSTELSRQVFTLSQLGIPLIELDDLMADNPNRLIEHCHMILYGMFQRNAASVFDQNSRAPKLNAVLNEAATPVHCVECPTGIDPDSGVASTVPLYASSTLSLTCPLQGLHAGKDFVGRHYLADTSCPREIYEQCGFDITKVFAEQPVIQIFPAEAGPPASP